MEPCVKPWTFCFALRKNNIEVNCALGIRSFHLLECILWISDRRSRNTHFGLYFFSVVGPSSHFPQRAMSQDFTISCLLRFLCSLQLTAKQF